MRERRRIESLLASDFKRRRDEKARVVLTWLTDTYLSIRIRLKYKTEQENREKERDMLCECFLLIVIEKRCFVSYLETEIRLDCACVGERKRGRDEKSISFSL